MAPKPHAKKIEVLAIIPARGGSKSIPYKNIALLAGRPLIAYALDAIKKSKLVTRVIVDTDDPKIAEVARGLGAETPYLRPAKLAQDDTPTMPVLKHALRWLETHEKYRPDYLLLVQATSPFILTKHIDDSIKLIVSKPEADSVTSVVEVPNNWHMFNQRLIDENGWLKFAMPKTRAKYSTRQAKPKRYAIGNLWIFTPEVAKTQNIPIGHKCLPLIIDSLHAFDVDTGEDLKIAEMLLPLVFQKHGPQS